LLCTWDAGPISPEGGDFAMRKYECVYIISPTLEEEQVKAMVERFNNLVSQNGELESTEEWGRKKLAYEVQDQKEGYYVLMNFSANPDFPAELERNFKITEEVLKYLVVSKE
jgi:small subunit ribosomal protein S6